jgi:hypothetical protein
MAYKFEHFLSSIKFQGKLVSCIIIIYFAQLLSRFYILSIGIALDSWELNLTPKRKAELMDFQ